MQSKKRWIVMGNEEDLSSTVYGKGLHPVTRRILRNRGVINEEQVEKFLYPKLSELYDPCLLPDMDSALKLIKNSIDIKRNIVIYGDYDADGITSTSLLYKCLKGLGAKISYFIPNRVDDGYGLNLEAIEEIISNGANLIITVDCGVTSIEEVKRCRELGVDIIITDHHECGDILPDTLIINPKRKDSIYPFRELAGAGVAFKLVQGLTNIYSKLNPFDYLELAAIGTVADIVPLVDENRIIVKYGLEAIKKTKNLGIKALLEAANIEQASINSGQIGFVVAPRINAVGRIDSADTGVELFICENNDCARIIADKLCDTNKKRQLIEEQIFSDAEKIMNGYGVYTDNIIVLESENWHIGVIGIVASKLVEKYYKPVILLSREGDTFRGSARSIPGINLFEALTDSAHLLIKYGGHELAAGLSIANHNFEEFKDRLNNYINQKLLQELLTPELKADCEIKEADIKTELIDELSMLEPYGTGNKAPLFLFKSLVIGDIKTVGTQNKHLKLKLKSLESSFDAIAFNMGYNINVYTKDEYIDIACGLDKNIWNGRESTQLIIKDIKHSVYKSIEMSYMKSINNMIGKIKEEDSFDIGIIKNLEINHKPVKYTLQEAVTKPLSLILVYNINIIESLLEYQDCFEICYEINDILSDKKTILVINPDISKLHLENISDVYLIDTIANFREIKDQCILNNDSVKWNIYNTNTAHDMDFINSIKPSRDDLERMYKLFKDEPFESSINKLSEILSLNRLCTYYCLKVLNELNIISISTRTGGIMLIKKNRQVKTSMDNSSILRKFDILLERVNATNIFFQRLRGNINEY